MNSNFDDDGEEVPILVDFSDTPQVGVIGKVPITIVTGYLGAGSMSPRFQIWGGINVFGLGN